MSKIETKSFPIKGGFITSLYVDGEIYKIKKFKTSSESLNWSNAFCDGYNDGSDKKYEDDLMPKNIKEIANDMLKLRANLKMNMFDYTEFERIRMKLNGMVKI